jgi:hypothetical protein
MAQTLHNGTTCPGNGKTVTVETGNHTVSLSGAGAGAVRFRAQLYWTLNVSNPARLLGLRGYTQQ